MVPPICTVAKQRVRKLCFEMSGTQGVHSNIRSWSLAGVPWVKIAVTQLTDDLLMPMSGIGREI